jgi:hypothetical protein
MLQAANNLFNSLSRLKSQKTVTSMQYAHDTTLIINDEAGSLITMELILRILGRILGLALTLKKAFSFLSTSMMKPQSW